MSAIASFLTVVWSKQPKPGYGTVARKDYTAPAGDEWTFKRLRIKSGGLRVRGSNVDNLYFTPLLYAKPNHRAANALATRWAYADLDEVNPAQAASAGVEPTVAWETSPGRYQCLWLLDRLVEGERFRDLNQKLTYRVGADTGGWDASQLLRIPGSVSTKHGDRHVVELCPTGSTPVYRYAELAALLRNVHAPRTTTAAPAVPGRLPRVQDVLAQYRCKLCWTDLQLLTTARHVKDRRGHLYHLYPRLFAVGMSREVVYVLVANSVLRKGGPEWLWADVCRGQQRFARAREADPGASDRLAASGRECENDGVHRG
jgi:hypothetical protein